MQPEAELQPTSSPLDSAFQEARATALEQVTALWQLQVDRVREQLESGWREQLQQIFSERFAEAAAQLEARFNEAVNLHSRENFDRLSTEIRFTTRAEATAQLNQVARGLKKADTREVWIRTLLEATADFCERAALFAISKRSLRFEGGLGIGETEDEAGSEFSLESAPALANAVESKDTVVALATPRELSEPLYRFLRLHDAPKLKVYLIPLVLQGDVVGLLYAEPDAISRIDVPALELLASFAVHSMEVEMVAGPAKSSGLISITGLAQAAAKASLTKEENELHLRAQRFARTRVAELLLYKVGQVKKGRADRHLYASLREEIEGARQQFRDQFLAQSPTMIDYLHQELVSSLAGGDPILLGPTYPGPLAA
jgi:hypothetical protein